MTSVMSYLNTSGERLGGEEENVFVYCVYMCMYTRIVELSGET